MTSNALSDNKRKQHQQLYIMDEFGRDLTLKTDEFGRDPSLRRSKADIEFERSVKELRTRMAGKSWAEIEWEEEEREEEEANKKLKELDLQRKKLWIWEAYELEEGEVFE